MLSREQALNIEASSPSWIVLWRRWFDRYTVNLADPHFFAIAFFVSRRRRNGFSLGGSTGLCIPTEEGEIAMRIAKESLGWFQVQFDNLACPSSAVVSVQEIFVVHGTDRPEMSLSVWTATSLDEAIIER